MKIVLRQSILLFAGVWWSFDKTLQSSFDHDTDNNNNNNNNNKLPLFGLSQTTQPQHTYKKLPRRTAEPVPARRPSITAGFSTGKEAATRGAKRLQSTTPGFYPVSLHQMAPPERGNAHPITAYSSFIDLERMKGWVGLVGWPVDGRLSHRPCHDTDTLLKFRQQTFMNMTYWWHSDSCTQKEKKYKLKIAWWQLYAVNFSNVLLCLATFLWWYCYRDFMPKYANNVSAFTLRVEPGRRQEEYG